MSGLGALAILDQASRLLTEAQPLEDIKAIRDKAEAARTYAKAAQIGLVLQNRAAELKLRAERKAGQFLASLKLRGGDRKSKGHRDRLNLESMGISGNQSKRWQRVGSVPEKEFSEYLRTASDLGYEVTSAGLLRIANKIKGRRRNQMTRRSGSLQTARIQKLDSQELITELMNHRQLLADVLRPVYEGVEFELERAERRIIGRLLSEMDGLMRQLKRL